MELVQYGMVLSISVLFLRFSASVLNKLFFAPKRKKYILSNYVYRTSPVDARVNVMCLKCKIVKCTNMKIVNQNS